jgi:hypothetical protein
MARRTVVYYSWDATREIEAPLEVIENRFPTLYELRRILFPRYASLADPKTYEQGIAGFLDHVLRENFLAFVQETRAAGGSVAEAVRVERDGRSTALSAPLLESASTLLIVSFDSCRTGQEPGAAEVVVVRQFLENPDHLVFVCPHHDIGAPSQASAELQLKRQEAEFHHHGDRAIPPQQRFGGFARALLQDLGVAVENRFGLHPATAADGSPAPLEVDDARDRLGMLRGVPTFNLHPHLPHLEPIGEAAAKFDVLARQRISALAPPHPFTAGGATAFNALLQSRPGVFAGTLLVGDATLWSSTAGGLDSLRRLWRNVLARPQAAASL